MTLLQALKFISVAQKEKDIIAPYQNHCVLLPNKALASNGVLSAGCNIAEDLECYPQTKAFINALSNCGDKLAITQLENTKLSIKSGRFSAVVSCHAEELPKPSPDPKIASISDDLRIALASVSHLAKEEGKTVLESAILLRAGTVAATNRYVILEAWHGIDLPKCIIPKVFVNAVCAVEAKLEGFGYSKNSVTFHFDDGSWLKSQIYAEQYPDVDLVWKQVEHKPLTEGFYDAIRTIEDFAENGKDKGTVYFSEKGMRSLAKEGEGAFFEFEGLPTNYGFKIKQLKQVEKAAKQVAFFDNKMFVIGDKIRGVVMGVKV